MNRGDIYFVDLDPTAGREQRGSRPVLVTSHKSFNAATRLPVILAVINGGDFVRRCGFAVALSGVKTSGVMRCGQPRVLNIDARNGRKIETLPPEIVDDVLARVATIFE